VFLPLAFVVGFFGQNFDNFPGIPEWVHSNGLMWTMIVVCVSVPVGMIWWFRRRHWL
jgi:magnesium transporter